MEKFFSKLRGRLKSESGVALLLVINMFLILTIAIKDFMVQTDVSHEMVSNARSRLQAYYLAKSALGISKLFLGYTKKVEAQISKSQYANQIKEYMGGKPLYKNMPPFSTASLRALVSIGGGANSQSEEESDNTQSQQSENTADDFMSSSKSGTGIQEKEKISDFLEFEGDFEFVISEENAKYSVNAFTNMVPTSESYDSWKRIMESLLLRPGLKPYFRDQDSDAKNLTHAIADYVDANGTINEYDKIERGQENSAYSSFNYTVKSGRMLTNSELRLVVGMNDDIYSIVGPLMTVYQSYSKINPCLADEKILQALIYFYSNYSECARPIKYSDEDKMAELLSAGQLGCAAGADGFAAAINEKLGLQNDSANIDNPSETEATSSTDSETQSSTSSTKNSKTNQSSRIQGCKVQLADYIFDTNDTIQIKALGTVDDVTVTVKEIINISDPNTSKWTVLYTHID